MGVRRSGIVLGAALSAAVLWMAGAGASLAGAAGPAGGVCQLQGPANLSPPLTSAPGSFTYSFTGMLSNCQANIAGAPTTGTVSAGMQVPETVTLICAGGTTTGTVLYQEPIPQGSGSCASSTTAGEALVTWGDGKHTVVEFTTTGALGVVVLQGTVVPSMTLTLVASSVPAGCTAPATIVITTDEPAFGVGQGSFAMLTFSPTTQDQNCVTMGVSSAIIDGVVVIGSTQ